MEISLKLKAQKSKLKKAQRLKVKIWQIIIIN